MKKQLNLIVGLIVLFSMLLGACAPAAAPTQAPAEEAAAAPVEAPAEAVNSTVDKPLIISGPSDIPSLDPHTFNGMFQRSVGYWIFDVLVMNSQDGKGSNPELAKEWKRIDPNTWEFYLVDNATFHNGEKFNADAVVYSFERMQSEQFKKYNALFYEVPFQELKKVDDYTVQIITSEPFNDLLWYLSRTFIVPPAHYAATSPEEVAINPVGSGPFKFVEWVKDDHITVVANEEYFQGAPDVKNAMVRVIPEASQRVNELVTGNVDLITNLSADLAKQCDSDNSRLVPYTTLRKMHLNLQLKNEYLGNLKVRQALQMAVDRQTIIDTLLGGNTYILKAPVNEPNNNPDLAELKFDPEGAKALLAEAGYPDGFEVLLQTTAGTFGSDKEISQLVAQDLEKIGVKATVEVIEENKLWELLETHDHPGIMFLGLGTYNLPIKELNTFYSTDIDNAGNFVNADFDAAIDAMKVETDEAARLQHSFKAQQILWDEMPWVYLWRLPGFQGQSNRLNLPPYADGYIDIWQAELTE